MRCHAAVLLIAACFLGTQPVRADFGGPLHVLRAMSPDGDLLVRVTADSRKLKPGDPRKHVVTYYRYDAKTDGYIRQSHYEVDRLEQMLYVSNAGDLLLVSLGEKEAITLYSREGKLIKSWDLDDFLTKEQVKACAETGATLQWLEEGGFSDRDFYFRGPSRQIRALQPPFTVMRGVDEKVWFSGWLDAANATLRIDQPENNKDE